jgi:hypothetical protein
MYKWICTLAIVVLIATQARAEIGIQPQNKIPLAGENLVNGLKTTSGLLDLKKLKFNHTIGVSYSSGYGGLNQYYLNDITYQISKPLIVRAQVGLVNQMSGNTRYGSTSPGGVQVVVPNVSLLYQPKPNIRIEVGFSTFNGYPYYFNDRYRRY